MATHSRRFHGPHFRTVCVCLLPHRSYSHCSLLEAAAWLFGAAIIVGLAAVVAATKVTWLLVAGVLTALTFASLAFAFSRSGHTIVAAILAAGAWLFGAFAVLVWFWR